MAGLRLQTSEAPSQPPPPPEKVAAVGVAPAWQPLTGSLSNGLGVDWSYQVRRCPQLRLRQTDVYNTVGPYLAQMTRLAF